MAVRGFQGFIDRFQSYQENFVLIGGAACDLWFQEQDLRFRATQDIDMVLILETNQPAFLRDFWGYIQEAGYQSLERSEENAPRLYRFEKTEDTAFPKMIELLSRSPDDIFPEEDQHIVPIRLQDTPSLSAILLHPVYYEFLMAHRTRIGECPTADVNALILFKVRAWLDLTSRQAKGDFVRTTDVHKHRTDVFRLAATLSGDSTVVLPTPLREDLARFLDSFPPDEGEWEAIQKGLRSSGLGTIAPDNLLNTIRKTYL